MSVDDELDRTLADFAERLHRAGDHIPSTGDTAGLDRVRSIRRRQRRRSRGAFALAAAGVVAVAGVGLNLAATDDTSDDLIVTATPPAPSSAPPASSSPASTLADDDDLPTTDAAGVLNLDLVESESIVAEQIDVSTFDAAPVQITDQVPTIDDPAPDGFPANIPWQPTWEFLVPWQDGFLLGRHVTVPPDLGITAVETYALVGEEFTEAIYEAEAFTPESADAALREAGFGERLDELLAEEPDLLQAYFEVGARQTLELQQTVDGSTWQSLTVELPDSIVHVQEVVSDGERLALLGPASTPPRLPWARDTAVWSSTDLTDWAEQPLEVPDPTVGFPDGWVSGSRQIGGLIVDDNGWMVTVRSGVHFDDWRLIDERFGEEIVGSSLTVDDGIVVIEVELETGAGFTERIEVDLAELGFTEEQQRAAVGFTEDVAVWTGSWEVDEASRRIDGFPNYWYGGSTLFDDGLVMWNALEVGVVATGSEQMRVFDLPAGDFSIQTVQPLGERLIVHANRPADSAALTYEFDPATGTWTPLEIDGLPARPEHRGAHTTDGTFHFSSRTLPVTLETVQTFEEGDYRYVARYQQPSTSYEVTRISTGEVVVAESADWRVEGPLAGQQFEHLVNGMNGTSTRITDPATGQVVIDMDQDDLAEMWSSATLADGTPVPDFTVDDFFPQDTALAVAIDTTRWMVHDLDEVDSSDPEIAQYSGNELVAVNGDVLLRGAYGEWFRHDLS